MYWRRTALRPELEALVLRMKGSSEFSNLRMGWEDRVVLRFMSEVLTDPSSGALTGAQWNLRHEGWTSYKMIPPWGNYISFLENGGLKLLRASVLSWREQRCTPSIVEPRYWMEKNLRQLFKGLTISLWWWSRSKTDVMAFTCMD